MVQGLKEAMLSLEAQPKRCSETPKNASSGIGSMATSRISIRVIRRVSEKSKQVDALHIRHGARQQFKRSEVR
jgi:plasmid stabilization system protein ParE